MNFRFNDLHSPINNYIVPGLISWLVGEPNEKGGLTRIFEMTREQMTLITPHSHRFGFECRVVQGSVEQTIWTPQPISADQFDLFSAEEVRYLGEPGKYESVVQQQFRFSPNTVVYKQGERYSMTHNDIHSIRFGKNTIVLLKELGDQSDETITLKPIVDGEVIDTMKVEPWMFRRTK